MTRLDPTKLGCGAHDFRQGLGRLVIGQDEALDQVAEVYQTYLAGLTPSHRPIGNFLFLGPTGTGKTRVAEATAEVLVQNPRAVIKVDCGEFQHSHEIAKLLGSPPGYLGHRETQAMFSQQVLNQYHTEKCKVSFVMFDEIEKASDALWNLLLGILDKGTLTLGDNRKTDFSSSIIFLTSNLGATEISNLVSGGLGFVKPVATVKNLATAGVTAARKKFTPEFINRLDKIVTFKPLGEKELRAIVDLELGEIQKRLYRSPGNYFHIAVTEAARLALLREGTDPRYGARHLKRAIEKRIVQALSNLIVTVQVRAGDTLEIGYDGQGYTFDSTPGVVLPTLAAAQMVIAVPTSAAGVRADR